MIELVQTVQVQLLREYFFVRMNQRRLRVATTNMARANLRRSEFQPMRIFGQVKVRL